MPNLMEQYAHTYPVYLSKKNLNCRMIDINNNEGFKSNYFLLSSIGNVYKPRIPMYINIEGALSSLSIYENISQQEFYVHVPYVPTSNYVVPLNTDVPYASYVSEVWFTYDIKVRCIGKIKVIADEGEGWSMTCGNRMIAGHTHRYEWVETYKSDIFVEEASKGKSNSIFFASSKQGLKKLDPKDFDSGKVTAYKSKKMAIIQGCGNREGQLSTAIYSYEKVDSALKIIYIHDPDIILDTSFSLYEVEDNGFYKQDGRHDATQLICDSPVKILKEYKYDSWVKTVIEMNKDIKFQYADGIDEKTAIKYGGYYGDNGIWNSIVVDKNTGKLLRRRVETLIINKDKVFLRKIPNSKNRYRLPGGSTEKGLNLIDQAINEVHEEAKLNVKNIFYTGNTYIVYNKTNWDKDQPISWEGKFTYIFAAEYAGKYNKNIHKVDQDNDMSNNGEFYKISDVWDMLTEDHKKSIKLYYRRKRRKIFNKKKNKLKESIMLRNYETSKIIVKEILEMDLEYTDEVILSDIVDRLDHDVNNVNYFDSNLPKCLPCFTPEEMDSLGVFNENPEDNHYGKSDMKNLDWYNEYKLTGNPGKDYIIKVRQAFEEMVANPTNDNKQRLLELGWNPEVAFNQYAINKASQRTREELKEAYGSILINTESLLESEEGGLVDYNTNNIYNLANDCIKYAESIKKSNPDLFKNIRLGFYHINGEKELSDDGMSLVFGYISNIEYDRQDEDIHSSGSKNTIIKMINDFLVVNKIFNYEVKSDDKNNLVLHQKLVSNDTSYSSDFEKDLL